MNPKRLYAIGFLLITYTVVAAVFSSWQWFPLFAGGVLLTVGAFIELRDDVESASEAEGSEIDEHFATVPQDDELADEVEAYLAQFGGTWDFRNGAPE